MSWILAFVGFAALIILHEFGHFIAAKAVGMRVERFMLFFPPIVWSVKRGETEYGIGSIPLGGYVKITGMTGREELPADVAYRAYHRQAPWKRIIVILAGPLMNVLIAFVILWGLFVFHGKAQVVDGKPVTTTTIEAVSGGSPAAKILKPGDRLIAVDGVRGSTEVLRHQIGTHTCPGKQTPGCVAATPARLTIERDGRTLDVSAKPKYSEQDKRALLGFGFGYKLEKDGPVEGTSDAVTGMWAVTKGTVTAITKIFYDSEARKQVSGVVGSYERTRQAVSSSAVRALELIAIISLSLAIVNLFPFLPLDGGHVFWALAEKVRRKPIPFEVMERAGIFGFLLVMFLFVVGLTNDVNTLRGKGFGGP